MKVLVLGAGVVGATAAFFLSRDGHRVEVLERQPGAGLETSFANGGQVSASHATPWATPETPWKALKWLGREDAPLVFRWARWDPALWSWSLRFLRNCTSARTDLNTERTVRIALYSREALKELRTGTDIAYDSRSDGILHIFRDAAEYEAQCHHAEVMSEAGLPQTPLDRAAIVQLEPALRPVADHLVGGIHSPGDESGDAHTFTREMARLAEGLGAVFHYGQSVRGLEHDGDRVTAVVTDRDRFTADVVVLCAGSWSPFLARQVGIDLPVYPAKGYSITLPLDGDPVGAPKVSITDDEHKMVYSRLGNRLRAAGTAELTGWNPGMNTRRAEVIRRHAQALFPDAGDYGRAETWTGLRPKTPDSVPYVCPTPIQNLYLNTGHGTLGWTMAVGSGRIIADLVAGRPAEIDIEGYGLGR